MLLKKNNFEKGQIKSDQKIKKNLSEKGKLLFYLIHCQKLNHKQAFFYEIHKNKMLEKNLHVDEHQSTRLIFQWNVESQTEKNIKQFFIFSCTKQLQYSYIILYLQLLYLLSF
eukprot:TRINITY_DN9622_c0_g1_i1.p1 TRINITY_DN9622_c0_g1~~TRINITY_DN9622_c0_g1_i1.p1  ORF type:complete len:113 (+),score=1.75 TRINITY_DN9622_c0_g1_i1:596-934(+)